MDNKFAKYDWDKFFKIRSHPIHKVHPYFAKFDPYIPRSLIEELSKPGDLVFDPYLGSGTTLVEANNAGRSAIGNDTNPLACLIARTKTTQITERDARTVTQFLNELEDGLNLYYQNPTFDFNSSVLLAPSPVPEFHNREYWFTDMALKELALIKGKILGIKNPKVSQLCLMVFSRIIVYASNQQGESRYKRIDKNRKPLDIFAKYKMELTKTLDAILDYTAQLPKEVTSMVKNSDSRNLSWLKDNSVDLIVTSPPYLNSWDYGLYHRFRFFWLDMDVRSYEQKEIGKHLRTIEGRSKSDEIERYKVDMELCIKEFARVLKTKKYCSIVNANAVVRKQFIDTNEMIIQMGKRHNLRLVHIINRDILGPHFGMHAALSSKKIVVEDESFKKKDGKIGKTEQILIFQKT